MNNTKIVFRAVINSFGTVLYIALVALFFKLAPDIFGKDDGGKSFIIPIVMLLLLVISATITGFLVLGKPAMLYVDGEKGSALRLLGYTVGFLALILAGVLSVLFFNAQI